MGKYKAAKGLKPEARFWKTCLLILLEHIVEIQGLGDHMQNLSETGYRKSGLS